MTNYYKHIGITIENPENFPFLCLLYDVAKQQINNNRNLFTQDIETDKEEISEYIIDEFNFNLDSDDIHEIQIYIKAKKNIHHKLKSKFHDKKDILELEMERIKSNIKRINNIIKF